MVMTEILFLKKCFIVLELMLMLFFNVGLPQCWSIRRSGSDIGGFGLVALVNFGLNVGNLVLYVLDLRIVVCFIFELLCNKFLETISSIGILSNPHFNHKNTILDIIMGGPKDRDLMV